MKNLYVLGILFIGWVLMVSSSIDVVAKRGDRTGSPVQNGNNQCGGTCHGGGTMDTPNITVTLLDASNASVAQYTPGEIYTIKTEITSNASGYGFETVALLNNNNNAGTSTAKSANVQIETFNSRSYSSQKGGASTSGVFETTWVAPSAGFSDVTFYASGVAVDKSNNNNGDLPTTPTSLMVTEKDGVTGGTGNGPVGVLENNQSVFSIYPNPVSDKLTVVNVDIKELIVFDINGKETLSSTKNSLDVSELNSGIYFVKVIDTKGVQLISKIVKK